jgi:hypothetical protein
MSFGPTGDDDQGTWSGCVAEGTDGETIDYIVSTNAKDGVILMIPASAKRTWQGGLYAVSCGRRAPLSSLSLQNRR